MLDGQGADVAICIQVDDGILIDIPGLGNVRHTELDVERIGTPEISDFHQRIPRSKKALWTVSMSGSNMTRR